MAQVKMEMNVPVAIDQAKYLDCIPGKFGHQLRLKGTINGEPESVMYLPGKVWAAKKALIEAEIIGEDDFNEEPEEALGIPLEMTEFVLTNKQVPGKNYGNLEVSWKTHAKATTSPKAQNTGFLLPNEEPGYLEALAGQPEASIVLIPSQQAKVEAMYIQSLQFVVGKVVPVWEAGKVAYDAGALNAAVATIMIQRGGR